MKLYPHQKKWSKKLRKILKTSPVAVLAAEERSGKTLAVIHAVQKLSPSRPLVVTTKAAIPGWKAQGWEEEIINYQALHKLSGRFDLIVCDEFHTGLQAYPKPSLTSKRLHALLAPGAKGILVSATPWSESLSQCYHPLKLFGVWGDYRNFYAWHRHYGIPETLHMAGRQVHRYHKTKEDSILPLLDPITITGTRKDVGHAYEPIDKVHTVLLEAATLRRIEAARRDKIVEGIELDTPAAEMNAVYQLAGGGLPGLDLSQEKIDYIEAHFDPDTTAIMAHYRHEQERLAAIFPHVYSSTADAEGIDLYHFDNLVIYSMSFSTSKYTQRRARQCNIKRDKPITVHYLLADPPALDTYIYDTVALKHKNFTRRVYERL